jgi:hypothetical protein
MTLIHPINSWTRERLKNGVYIEWLFTNRNFGMELRSIY